MGWPLQEVLGVPWCMVTCEKGVLGMAGGTGVLEGGRPGDGDWRGSREGKVYFGGWREGCGGKVYWVYWGGAGVAVVGVSSVLGCPRDISRVALLAVPAVTF